MNLLYVEIKGSRGAHMIICILRVIFGQIFISLFIDHHRWFLKWAMLHGPIGFLRQSLVFSLTETPRTWSPNGMSSALGEGHLDAYLLERYDDIGMFIRCRITLSILTNSWLIESVLNSIKMNSGLGSQRWLFIINRISDSFLKHWIANTNKLCSTQAHQILMSLNPILLRSWKPCQMKFVPFFLLK